MKKNINLPFELINKIIMYREVHPIAILINEYIKYYDNLKECNYFNVVIINNLNYQRNIRRS